MIYKITLLEAERVFGKNLQVGQKFFGNTTILLISNNEVMFQVYDNSDGESFSYKEDSDIHDDDFSISGGEYEWEDFSLNTYNLHFGAISIYDISPEKMLTIVQDMVDYLKSNGHELELKQ